jgi:hypothetical protein
LIFSEVLVSEKVDRELALPGLLNPELMEPLPRLYLLLEELFPLLGVVFVQIS